MKRIAAMTDPHQTSVLILGAAGRFGRHAAAQFNAAGWVVRALVRPGRPAIPGIDTLHGDATDAAAVTRAAMGVDVIVHAVNSPYPDWARQVPPQTAAVIAAARASGATLLIPGNVYPYGADLPPVLTEATPHAATSGKPLIRRGMEAQLRAACEDGVRCIVLRAGDFIDDRPSGNWFEGQIAAQAGKGKISYPGALDRVHAWAWLPDMARAARMLAQRRAELPAFAAFGFPGYAVTGAELIALAATAAGRPMRAATFPWPLVRLGALVSPMMRELLEMRYLWDRPHRIDGAALAAALPSFTPTPALDAIAASLAGIQAARNVAKAA
jgi:nucleoside-diphosphate-sugar epimerase